MATAEAVAGPGIERALPARALAAGGVSLALLALAVAAAHPARSPLSPDHAGGDTTWSWVFLCALAGSFAFYGLGVWTLARGGARLSFVVAIAVAFQLIPLAGPVLLSTDVYTYLARGRVDVVYGENPYRVAPGEFPDDPAVARMGASWRDRPTGYGPAFTFASAGLAAVPADSPATAAWIYRSLAAAAMVVTTCLAAILARRRAFAAAFVGWNPLLAVHFAGAGHNDALMMMLVLAALALAARSRLQLAGVAWALAVAIKWLPVVFLPLRALEARATGRPVRHAGFAAAAAVIAGLAFWRYGAGWLESFPNFSGQLGRTTSLSMASLLTKLGLPESAAIALLAGVFVVAYLWLLREAWKGRARLGLCAALVLLTTSWLVPWYAVWVVPLAAIEEDRLALGLAFGLSAYLLRGAVPL